ncbi:hypothetical protein H6770_02220 [Candidatus Peribacteria bacterium]|nr:hypothetical protein [Candidatus Peribacteria bacterium]
MSEMPDYTSPETKQLLAQHARLLSEHGVDSQEELDFVEQNKGDTEFVELSKLARGLKSALTKTAGLDN